MQDDAHFILAGKNVQTLYNSTSESFTCTKLRHTEHKLQCNIHVISNVISTDWIQCSRAVSKYLKRFLHFNTFLGLFHRYLHKIFPNYQIYSQPSKNNYVTIL